MKSIETKRRAMKIPISSLCSRAGVGRRTYDYAVAGTHKVQATTVARLNAALNRFRLGFGGEAAAIAPEQAYKMCLINAAFWLKSDKRTALNSDPSRRATANAEWKEAADVRRLAFWIATQQCGFRGSDVARAAGVTKAAVSAAVKELEWEAEAEGGNDRALAKILREIEEVFS